MANINEISVPVRLKVMQDSVASFLKILDNLLPNTDNWRALSKLINSMTADALKLLALLSKPFSSLQLFNSTEKTIDKLEEAAARVAIVMLGLKFSDIKLTPALTDELLKFNDEINTIRESYQKLLELTKAKLLSDTNTADLLGNLKGDVLSKSFSEIESAVDNHINALKKKVNEKDEQYKALLSNKLLGESATLLVTNGLSAGSIGEDVFNKFLRSTKSGGLAMNFGDAGVSKQALLNAIGEMYHLEPGEILKKIEESLGKSLNGINITEINKWFTEQGTKSGLFSGVIRLGKNAQTNAPVMSQDLESLRSLFREYEAIQQEIARLKNTEITPASAQNDAKIAELNGQMELLKTSIFSTTAAMNNYKTGAAGMQLANSLLRNTLKETNALFLRLQAVLNSFNAMKTTVANFMGFYQVLNLTKKAIKEAANHIKELDSVMNKISIVTDMDTSDLWGLIDLYSKMAQTYGTTIKGAYEVSLIYYQQGLDTADVLTLTNETLKLAKVSGLDYAATTDYMTTALRGFKMEMSEAATVVDVYSNLAANTAVSLEELAVAMSKTASSMESVGSSFQETSAMIATMVAVTRESATNIGSALKSIAARYGEMKSDPLAMADSEGEELVYNKVDAALLSVGITLKDTEGQFRNFTDVIIELSEKWNLLESTLQRYIATLFAGNRQQSRFLALVSNKDLLEKNLSVAENSEDTGTVQALKALDSLESKIEQVRVAYLQFYTTVGIESVWKSFLDGAKSVVNTLNGMPKLFGKLPVGAINAIALVVNLLKTFAFQGLLQVANLMGQGFKAGMNSTKSDMQSATVEAIQGVKNVIEGLNSEFTSLGQKLGIAISNGLKRSVGFTKVGLNYGNNLSEINLLKDWQSRISYLKSVETKGETVPGQLQHGYASLASEMQSAGAITQEFYNKIISGSTEARRALELLSGPVDLLNAKWKILGTSIGGFGLALNMISLVINTTTRGGKALSGTLLMIAGAAITAGTLIKSAGEIAKAGWSAVPWVQIASGIIAVISGVSQMIQAASPEAKLEEITAKAEDLSNKAKQLKADYKSIENAAESYKKLEEARYDSAEAADEYRTAVDKLADTYPQLIESYDENNEAVLNASAMDRILTEAREASARATLLAAEAEAKKALTLLEIDKNTLQKSETWGTVFDAVGWWSNKNAYANWNELNLVNGEGVDQELKLALNELYTSARDGNIEGITTAYQKVNQIVSDNGIKLSDNLSSGIDKILDAAALVEQDQNVIKASRTTTVGAYLNSLYVSLDNNLLSGKNSQGFLNFANREIEKRMQGETDFTSWTIAPYALDVINSLDASFGDLTSTLIELLDKILSSADQYTKKDLEDLATDFGIQIDEWVYSLFDDKTQENIEFLKGKTNKLKSLDIDTTSFDSLLNTSKEMSLNERLLFQSGLNLALALKKNGQNPNDFINQFADFYSNTIKLPAELRNALIDEFEQNGYTREGLEATLAWISENIHVEDADMPDLSTMIESFVPNLALTIEALKGLLTENLDGIESIFSDFANGVKSSKLMKTIAKANKLGIKISADDFYTDGEKFFLLQDALDSAVQNIYENYGEQLEKYTGELSELLEAYNSVIDKESELGFKTGADVTSLLLLILGALYTNYFDENGNLTEEAAKNTDEVLTAINTAYESTSTNLTNYMAWLNTIKEGLILSVRWKLGNYSGLDGKLATSIIGADEEEITFGYAIDRIAYLAAHPESITDEELENVDLIFNAIELFLSGASKLLSDVTTKGADYIQKYSSLYEGLSSEFVNDIATRIEEGDIIGAVTELGQETGKTVSEINQSIVKAIKRQLTDLKAASAIVKKNVTLGEIESYISDHGWVTGLDEEGKDVKSYSLENFIDNQGNIIQEDLAGVYQWDAASASYKATGTLEEILSAWEAALGFTLDKNSELYQELILGWTSDAVKNADKADWGKLMASGISSLSSAKIGTRVDLSQSPELLTKLEELGYNVTDGYYEVISEYARDSMLLLLESTDAEVNATLRPIQEQIKLKRAKGAATQGIMGLTATREAFRNYLLYSKGAAGADTYQDSTIDAFAKLHGYVWDEDLLLYTATLEALTSADKEILEAIESGASDEYIKQLREKRGELASHFRKDEKRDALVNLLSNYKDAAGYIDDLYTQFGEGFSPEDLKEKGVLTEVDGKLVINIEKLQGLVDGYDDLFEEVINQIADEYIDNAQKAGSLMTLGTTSKTEMEAFLKAYEKVMGEGSVAQFAYDMITHTMVLDPTQLRSYLARIAAKKEFGLTPEQLKNWVDSLVEALTTDNLDFSKVLDGSATLKDTDTLRRNLELYFKLNASKLGYRPYQESIENWATGMVDKTMADLAEGGQTTIEALKSTGKELSTEEIEAAYRAQVAPLAELSETLSNLEAGSIVAKNLIEALRKVGFEVSDEGVVLVVGDLVTAYRGIYWLMKHTGEATLSELNKVMGNLLDNRDGEQQVIDALSNASNMTYSLLAEIYTKAGKELTEAEVSRLTRAGTIKSLGGNKMMISNFDQFAADMGWSAGSEEYTNALSTYRDNLISYDKKLGDSIKANFDTISNAKVGDLINLTLLLSKFPEFEAELETTFGNIITDGVLTVRDALTLPLLAVAIGNKAVLEGGMLADELEAFVASIHDNILNGITGAFGYSTSGTNSIASMQAFAQEYNTLTGGNKDFSELFGYDTVLNTFTLHQNILDEYIQALKAQLETLGLSGDALDEYIKDLTDTVLRENIELDNFLNANTLKSRNDEANKLILQIRGLSNYLDIQTSAIMSAFDLEDATLALEELAHMTQELIDLIILQVLESGGQDAFDLFKQINPNASSDKLEATFNSQINKLTGVLDLVGDLVTGEFVGTEGKLYEVLARAGAVDTNGVVKAGFDMVEVYAAIYAEMTKTAGATTTGLNDAYAKLLTAQDLTNIDITETLKNGAGMSYADFGSLLAKYDIKFEDYMRDHWDTVMRDGFGNIRITDWEGFAKNIFKTDDLDAIRNTDEYISAFKAYNDGLIELNKNAEEAIKDEILQISNAKVGDQLNLSYLWTALLNVIDQAIENIAPENYNGNVDLANRPIVPAEKMKQVFSQFENDYATLYSLSFMSEDFGDYAHNVGMLFTSITASGEIVEDLASYVKALYDEAAGDVDRMLELDKIENGGKGLMLFGELFSSYEHLSEVADDIHVRAADKDDINYYLKALQAVGANYADGILTISEDADMIAIGDILSILSDLSGVDLGEEGRAAIKDAVDDLLKNIASLISSGAQGSLTNSDAATLSQWYRSTAKDYGAVTDELDFTKTAEGLKLTESSLANVYDLMKRIDSVKADALLDDIISTRESFLSLTGALREFNDAMRLDGIDGATNKLKNLNGTLSNTAQMMQDVVLKAMTSPDAMNFMSNSLPDDMQTAVNAWENASEAIKTITAAEKNGYMGVQDFYNIVNTASSLMTAAGKEFEVAGMDAATLLQKGALSVKVVDGKLTVDISSAGLDIVGSTDLLKQNMTTGINELADAEIAIIDAEILVLEILATMEQMGDMDVDIDNNGLSFEISDIFKDNGAFTDIDDGVNNMTDYLAKLKEIVERSDETIETFLLFKINGTSLYELLGASADVWKKVFGSEENISKFMQQFTKGIEGWDLEGNLDLDVLEFMKSLGQDYSIDLGDLGVFRVNASGITYVIDFNDKERMDAARKAAESLGLQIGQTDEEFKNYLKNLVAKGSTENKDSTLDFEQNFVLKVATGEIEVVTDEKTGDELYKVGGKLYKNKSVANAVAELIQAGAKADWKELQSRKTNLGETETINGTMTVGKAEIEVTSDGKGNVTYLTPGGEYKGKSLDELYTQWFKGENKDMNREENGLEFKQWQVKKGISLEPVFEVDNKEGNTKTNEKLRSSIQDAIDNGIKNVKLDDDKHAYEVQLDNGVNITIPKGKINVKEGLPLNEAVLEYLRDNYNIIDLDLKDTIQRAITDAFTSLPTALENLDATNIQTIASAFSTAATNCQTLIDKLPLLQEQLNSLKSPDINIGGSTNGTQGLNVEAINTVFTAIITAFLSLNTESTTAGLNVGEGLTGGMENSEGSVTATAASMGLLLLESLKSALGVNSPSIHAEEMAENVGAGLEVGMSNSTDKVKTAAEQLGQALLEGLLAALKAEAITQILSTVLEAFSGSAEDESSNETFKTLGTTWGTTLVTAFTTAISTLPQQITALSTAFSDVLDKVDSLAADESWSTIKDNLTTIIQLLGELAANKDITISVKLNDSASTGLNDLLKKIQALKDALFGKNEPPEGEEGGSEGSPSEEPSGDNKPSQDSSNLPTEGSKGTIGTVTADNVDISNSGSTGELASVSTNSVDASNAAPAEVPVVANDVEFGGSDSTTLLVQAEATVTPVGGVEEIPGFTTTQTIDDEGGVYNIPGFETEQTINTTGGVYGIAGFTTVQTIVTVGGGGCFVAGTKIYMADGTVKNIEDVYLNDVVIAYNPDTNEFVPKKVIDGYTHHNTARIVEITFSDGTSLKMTPSHPILTTKGWRSLDPVISLDEHGILPTWLEIGDKVNGYFGEIEIVNIAELSVPKNYDTYDFEVEDCHTFLAEGIPVHNAMITGPAQAAAVNDKGKAKGNATWLNPMGLSFAKGNTEGLALAGGRTRTLMGELGPELYVSGGRYFVAGLNGAEFVNLPDDAIVFNHMQTKSLMSKGLTGHGTPVTNERNAISWAKGNVNGGFAMASASAALAQLKALRALWESLASASISDLVGAAGSGGGGGGGGGGKGATIVDPSVWVDTVERWYNLTQKIAKLEKDITHEQSLRSKLSSDWTANGKQYYLSLKRSLQSLQQEITAQEQLNLSRRDYYNKRVEALKKSPFGKLYSFDEDGQMKMQNGAMEWLTDLYGFDSNGKANHTDKEKYEILQKAGYGSYMKYDSNGAEIKMDSDNDGEITDQEKEDFYSKATQAYKDRMDDYAQETQNLYDEIREGEDNILEKLAEMNEITKEIRDNQMSVEESVLDAIEDMRLREIDALQDERDKLEESTGKYIEGLSNALDKEKQMYETQESVDDLNKSKRRLAILERSGGSAEDIASLRSEINSSERDLYFDLQQLQIDAILAASDLEIERMDNLILIMTDTLEYLKEYGLLWGEVSDVMQRSAADITSFIHNGDSGFWSKSPLASADAMNSTLFLAEQWTEYRDDLATAKESIGDNKVTAEDIKDNVSLLVTMTRTLLTNYDFDTFNDAMKAEYGKDWDKDGTYRAKFKEMYNSDEGGDLTAVSAAIRQQYEDDLKALKGEKNKARKAAWEAFISKKGNSKYDSKAYKKIYYAEYDKNGAESAEKKVKALYKKDLKSNKNGGTSNGESNNADSGCNGACTGECQGECTAKCATACKGNTKSDVGRGTQTCLSTCTGICSTDCTGECKGGCKTTCTGLGKGTIKSAKGGYVGHGIYELGEMGTETVLTASQTKVLRDNILSNRSNSLISLLKSYNEHYSDISTPLLGAVTTEDNSVNIDHIEMTMQVQQIANDYDAKRAGEEALNEMMRIARKYGATNSVRR